MKDKNIPYFTKQFVPEITEDVDTSDGKITSNFFFKIIPISTGQKVCPLKTSLILMTSESSATRHFGARYGAVTDIKIMIKLRFGL